MQILQKSRTESNAAVVCRCILQAPAAPARPRGSTSRPGTRSRSRPPAARPPLSVPRPCPAAKQQSHIVHLTPCIDHDANAVGCRFWPWSTALKHRGSREAACCAVTPSGAHTGHVLRGDQGRLGPHAEVVAVLDCSSPKLTTLALHSSITTPHLGPHAEVVAVLDDAAGHGQPRPPPCRLVVSLRRVDDARQRLQGMESAFGQGFDGLQGLEVIDAVPLYGVDDAPAPTGIAIKGFVGTSTGAGCRISWSAGRQYQSRWQTAAAEPKHCPAGCATMLGSCSNAAGSSPLQAAGPANMPFRTESTDSRGRSPCRWTGGQRRSPRRCAASAAPPGCPCTAQGQA